MDSNLTDVVEAARKMGFRVHVSNSDLCDVTVQFRNVTELWEVKTESGTFTDTQKKLRKAGWQIRTIRSVDDVRLARNELTFGRAN